jgi:hypothetical protein
LIRLYLFLLLLELNVLRLRLQAHPKIHLGRYYLPKDYKQCHKN